MDTPRQVPLLPLLPCPELPEYEDLVEIGADRVGRICDVVSALALVCIALTLWRQRR